MSKQLTGFQSRLLRFKILEDLLIELDEFKSKDDDAYSSHGVRFLVGKINLLLDDVEKLRDALAQIEDDFTSLKRLPDLLGVKPEPDGPSLVSSLILRNSQDGIVARTPTPSLAPWELVSMGISRASESEEMNDSVTHVEIPFLHPTTEHPRSEETVSGGSGISLI